MTTVRLDGLLSGIEGEERALAMLKVEHNGQEYDWKMFVPIDVDLSTYIESKADEIGQDIDAKEAEWEALTPKTRMFKDPFSSTEREIPIGKEEIVRPDIPDYYAKRRAEYPPLSEQLDALWKGGQAMADMQAKILDVKNKFPKP